MYHLIGNSVAFAGYSSFHSSGQRFDEVVAKFQPISNSMLFANDVLAEQESLVQDLYRHCLRIYSRDFQSVRDHAGELGGQFSM